MPTSSWKRPSAPGSADFQSATTGGARQIANEQSKGWYSGYYLPHLDIPGLVQSGTFRLADALTADVIERINVRDDAHLPAVMRAVETNPVRAGLVKAPEEWLFPQRAAAGMIVAAWKAADPVPTGCRRSQY